YLTLDLPQLALKRLPVAQLRERRAVSLLRHRAASERLRIAIIQVLRQLLGDFSLARRFEFQTRQPLSDLLFPLRHGRLTVLLDFEDRITPGVGPSSDQRWPPAARGSNRRAAPRLSEARSSTGKWEDRRR